MFFISSFILFSRSLSLHSPEISEREREGDKEFALLYDIGRQGVDNPDSFRTGGPPIFRSDALCLLLF